MDLRLPPNGIPKNMKRKGTLNASLLLGVNFGIDDNLAA